MRIISTAVATLIGLMSVGMAADQPDCIASDAEAGKKEIKDYPPGGELLSVTYFLPAGAPVDLVLKEQLRPQETYYGRIESEFEGGDTGQSFIRLLRNSISAKKIPDNH